MPPPHAHAPPRTPHPPNTRAGRRARTQVLYLHGNQISSLNDVLKLQALPRLEKVTLHGNPISEMKAYKMWVCAHLPGVKNLDFSGITKVERDKVATWMKANRKRFES